MKKYLIQRIFICFIFFLCAFEKNNSIDNLNKTVIRAYKEGNKQIEYFTFDQNKYIINDKKENNINYKSFINHEGKLFKSIDGGRNWYLFETEDTKKLVFDIYPNPASDFLNINLKNLENEIEQIEVYGLEGKLQSDFIIIDKINNSVNISSLQKGLYILFVKSKNGKSNSMGFLKN